MEVLNNGGEFVPQLLRALRGAKRSINIAAYIWKEGRLSEVAAALGERAEAGVLVRVLLDAVGTSLPGERIESLKKSGVQVEIFRPLRFGELTRFHRRNHRRAIVIDGTVGFTGGIGMSDEWLGRAENPDHWRDLMVRVTGRMARSLQAAFVDLWAGTRGEILSGPDFYPSVEELGPAFVHVASSPSPDPRILSGFFWFSISCSKEKLYIAAPYFIPDESTRDALIRRAQAGVDVRILLPGANIDSKSLRWAAQYYYEDYLRAGVKLFEYQPTFMHRKALTADGIWSIVGSSNIDIRSWELNEENVLGIQDRALASKLESDFLADLKESRRVTLKDWQQRPLWNRVLEAVAVFFAEQL